jgi:hypothetical protein
MLIATEPEQALPHDVPAWEELAGLGFGHQADGSQGRQVGRHPKRSHTDWGGAGMSPEDLWQDH